jgi:hypothetical protein
MKENNNRSFLQILEHKIYTKFFRYEKFFRYLPKYE